VRLATRLAATVCGLALMAWSEAAHADELAKGTWSLGVERLHGLTYTSETARPPGGNVRTSALNYSAFANPAGGQRTVYSAPRLALDYFITDRWSAGLGLGLMGGSTKLKSDAGTRDGPGVFNVVLAPRAGYLVAQASWIAFWPKAGFTYTRAVAKTDNATAALYRGALTFEAGVLLLPGKNVAIGVTPTFDWGLIGANSAGSGDDIRATAIEVGLQNSLCVYF
jgi:hypothetical protein